MAMLLTALRARLTFLLAVMAACGSDSTLSSPPPDPEPGPPVPEGLWTASASPSAILRLDPTQLSGTGERAPVPAVVLSGLGHPTALAFDGDGSLWVSDNVAQTIAKYRGADLTASGSPAPAVVLTETENAFPLPLGLAFDADGNLWVANLQARNVVAFSPAQLAVTGAPTPQVVLSSTDGSLALPVGLAFDAEGSLWVVGGAGTLTKFARTSLGASGAPEPSARLTIAGHQVLWSAAFWPRPAGLPLN